MLAHLFMFVLDLRENLVRKIIMSLYHYYLKTPLLSKLLWQSADKLWIGVVSFIFAKNTRHNLSGGALIESISCFTRRLPILNFSFGWCGLNLGGLIFYTVVKVSRYGIFVTQNVWNGFQTRFLIVIVKGLFANIVWLKSWDRFENVMNENDYKSVFLCALSN